MSSLCRLALMKLTWLPEQTIMPFIVNVLLGTDVPTSTPTTFFSATPTSAPTITCRNDRAFKLQNKKKKKCGWVMHTKCRRKKQCVKQLVHKTCPISCGLCCADNGVKFKIKNKKKGCVWLGKGNRADIYRQKNRIKTGYAETCNNCVKDPLTHN